MRGVDTRIEEILDIVLNSTVLVLQLLIIPDWTIHLCTTVHLRTPRSVLDEGLLTVPTLTELVLELRQCSDATPLQTTVVADLEVAVAMLLTSLGGDDDHTIGSTATIQSCSSSTLQHGHVLDIVRVDVRHTTDGILELFLLFLRTTEGGLYEGHTIHNVEGLVVTINRADTTDDH